MNWREYNRESRADRMAQKERAAAINAGERSPIDGLTDAERTLLQAIRNAGFEIAQVGEWQRYVRRSTNERGAA